MSAIIIIVLSVASIAIFCWLLDKHDKKQEAKGLICTEYGWIPKEQYDRLYKIEMEHEKAKKEKCAACSKPCLRRKC